MSYVHAVTEGPPCNTHTGNSPPPDLLRPGMLRESHGGGGTELGLQKRAALNLLWHTGVEPPHEVEKGQEFRKHTHTSCSKTRSSRRKSTLLILITDPIIWLFRTADATVPRQGKVIKTTGAIGARTDCPSNQSQSNPDKPKDEGSDPWTDTWERDFGCQVEYKGKLSHPEMKKEKVSSATSAGRWRQ